MADERMVNEEGQTGEEEEITEAGVPGEDGGQEESGQEEYITKTEAEAAVERRLARERKKLAKDLGVSKLEDAASYLQAGQAVTRASGLRPNDIVSRLAGQQQQGRYPQQGYQQQQQQQQQQRYYQPDQTSEKLEKIETLLESEREEKVRSTQETEAKKEFGDLFDSNKDDIMEKAEETGLSLIDAATIVLRPKLREHISNQQRAKQDLKGKRRVEGSGEPPGGGPDDAASKLSSDQKRVAQKMNLSYKDYYAQLKELGRVEE